MNKIMIQIYESALHKARARVWEDDRYSEVIKFCKNKLADHWYWRHQCTWNALHGFETL